MSKLFLFMITIGLIIVDQLTKHYFVAFLVDEGSTQAIIPGFFNFTLAYNYGAAFSFLANHSGWQRWFFTIISLVASFGLIFWILKLKNNQKFLGISLAMILSGAVGNLIDRSFYGRVTDFLHLFYKQYHFPIFNFADVCICVGVFLMLFVEYLEHRRAKN